MRELTVNIFLFFFFLSGIHPSTVSCFCLFLGLRLTLSSYRLGASSKGELSFPWNLLLSLGPWACVHLYLPFTKGFLFTVGRALYPSPSKDRKIRLGKSLLMVERYARSCISYTAGYPSIRSKRKKTNL